MPSLVIVRFAPSLSGYVIFMITWLIISICLYLEGAYWAYHYLRNPEYEMEPQGPAWIDFLAACFWWLMILIVIGEKIWEGVKGGFAFIRKYVAIIFLLALCSCDMGQRTDPEEDKYIKPDSIAAHDADTAKPIIKTTGWISIKTSAPLWQERVAKPVKHKKNIIADLYWESAKEGHETIGGTIDTAYSIYAGVTDTAKPVQSVASTLKFDADSNIFSGTTIIYDVFLSSPENGTVAYLKPDSPWVVIDSSETLKMLLRLMEQEAFYHKHYIKKFIPIKK